MPPFAQLVAGLLLVYALIWGGVWLFYRAKERNFPSLLPWLTVPVWQRALIYRAGRFKRLAGPGRVWWLGRMVHLIGIDEQQLVVENNQRLCSDRRPVHVGANVQFRIADPRRAFEAANDLRGAFTAEVIGALDDLVAARPLVKLLDDRRHLDTLLYATLAPLAERRGLELIQVLILNLYVPPEVLASIGFDDSEQDETPDPFRAH